MNAERIIRVAQVPREAHPLSIYSGEPPAPLPARWAAIALSPTPRPVYSLYLLGETGSILEVLQHESMRVALDQAHALLRLDDSSWSTCKLEVPDGNSIDPKLFSRYLAG